ncbi:MAG TPA: hypothetical protein VHF25_13330, partial [Nitriliruptorales bacterium]|nr:hypothetical protein [Nitriliruptorales bacterium]
VVVGDDDPEPITPVGRGGHGAAGRAAPGDILRHEAPTGAAGRRMQSPLRSRTSGTIATPRTTVREIATLIA